ncbi:MAG: hypothetical protein JWM92_364 [Candidatus Nomurabacteria bacterium]|nr:hypothetical protein [Candidatus Nomurabacteria bacterium]
MNKKYILSAAGLLAVGAISSIAMQSFAQSAPQPAVATVAPSAIVAPAAAVKADDIETNDDAGTTAISASAQASTVSEANDKETADDGSTAATSQDIPGANDGENVND